MFKYEKCFESKNRERDPKLASKEQTHQNVKNREQSKTPCDLISSNNTLERRDVGFRAFTWQTCTPNWPLVIVHYQTIIVNCELYNKCGL